jgi:5'-3' exonuclease
MILVDLNQVLISNLMAQTRGQPDVTNANEDMIRHMVMNSLRGFNVKFRNKYGKMVLCSDASNPWRKDIFPYYKYSRKKGREESSFDWDNIFNIITNIKNELKENFPYVVMYNERCEADDIIATLTKYYYQHEKIMIVSGDKDFIQLQFYKGVDQYAPIQKRMIGIDEEGMRIDAREFLLEQIMKGDRSDGIPNILSPDDCFVTGEKQKPMTKKRLEEYSCIDNHTDEIRDNWLRNSKLIDLNQIPQVYEDAIINSYRSYKVNDRSKLLTYFIENKLKSLMENIGDF